MTNSEKLYKDVLEKKEKFGWTCITIFPETIQNKLIKPGFCYTIGLWENYGIPEIMTTGLNGEVFHSFVSIIIDKYKSDKDYIKFSEINTDLSDYPALFTEITSEGLKEEYFIINSKYCRENNKEFKACQFLWTDTNSLFPFEIEFDYKFRKLQPLVGEVDEEKFYNSVKLSGRRST